MTKFSVLIPVYNREGLIGQTIESVLNQTYDDFELIVIDDGSTDRTAEVIAAYGDRLIHLTQKNQGPEVARNSGAQAAKGNYLAFLDSDDLMFPWALEVYAEVIRHFEMPSLVLGSLLWFQGKPPSRSEGEYSGSIEALAYRDYFSKEESTGLSNSMIVLKRSIFDEIGGLRTSSRQKFYSDEASLVLRCGSLGPMVMIKNPKTVAFRLHEDNSANRVPWMCQGALSLIHEERSGMYPGGKARLLDRYATIGGYVHYWSMTAFRHGFYLWGIHLLVSGWPMIFAAVM